MVDLHCMAHKYGHLPEGLNELMTDISREVLRAQPEDIHGFIARYLGALLEARKALIIASDVCEDIQDSCYRTEQKEVNEKEEGSVDERKRPFKEEMEANAQEDKRELGDAVIETNESQSTVGVGQPAQDESPQDRPGSSYVETEEYYRYRQHRDFWSHSVFSLPGSYMNLPKWKPYSVYDSINTASKPSSSKRGHSGNSDYIVDRMCEDADSST